MARYTFTIGDDEIPGEHALDPPSARRRARELGALHRQPIGIRCDGVAVSLPQLLEHASALARFLESDDAASSAPVARPNWCGPCARYGRTVPGVLAPNGAQTGRCAACLDREREARARKHAEELRAELDAKARKRT